MEKKKPQKTTYMYIGFEGSEMAVFFFSSGVPLFFIFLAWLAGLCREDWRWYSILIKSKVL